MIKFLDKALKSSLALLVVFSTLFLVSPSIKVEAEEVKYEIYPTPHELIYNSNDYVIRSQVNVVFEDEIDEPTRKRMTEVLELKNKQISTSNQKVVGKTNILVGTHNSNGYVDNYVKANYNVEESLFDKFGANFVASNNGEIIILGKDTDGAFYGITSLKHIFNQMDGSTIRNFEIKDYADTNTRGFIEGYYGIPWSNEDRMSLMKFGGDFKMTSYVFAPKDDSYHKELWRELYPEEELNAIKEMVQVGIDSKCRFVWTAHPFMGGFDASRDDEEIAALLNKFDQLYDAGVRQFGVLGDDVGNLDRSVVIKMMNAVSNWAKEKGDVYDSVFCPAGYNHSWQGNYSELNDYDTEFPDDVQIFWTGEAVCQPVEQRTLDHFRDYLLPEGASKRRSPLFWLNWPVNDINGSRLMMGKGSLLHTDINIEDLNGVVTNPMQEAEASKIAIFAVADYSWNVKDFDDDQSWADSFKYIDKEANKELHTLAKHMSNPQPNGHGLVLAESEELQPLINEFKNKLVNNESIIEIGNQLINEMNIIIDACDGFHANSKNENLKEELLPFTNSLKDLTTAIKDFTESSIAIEKNDMVTAFNKYSNASSSLINSQNHVRKLLNGTAMVSPGSTHLIPLAQTLQEKLSGPINDYVAGGEVEQPLVISASSNITSWYSGKIEDIVDGNNSTAAWHDGYETVGQYFQVNLSKPTTIYGIDILNGTTNKPQDTFGFAKIQYSTDGTTFQDLNNEVYGEYASQVNVSNIEVENVVAVRYICTETSSGRKWPAMREFTVITQPIQEEGFTKEVIYTQDGWTASQNELNNIIDGNLDSSVHFNVRQTGYPDATNSMIPGDYIGIKLSKPITLGKINILQGRNDSDNDYMKNAQLQYSLNGEDWIDVGDIYRNTINVVVDLSDQNITAQYVRLVNTENQNNWFAIREFSVDAKIYHNGKVFTNVGEYNTLTADYFDDTANITPVQDITLAKDEYIGLKLDRIHEIKNIVSDLTNNDVIIQVSKNNYEWETVTTGDIYKDARYIRIINNQDMSVTFNINEFVVNTVEVGEKKISSTNFSVADPLNVFDGDWTTATAYQSSQNAGKYFVYDLGQEIDMTSFKAVCTDSEWDYPRHGKFSVSVDGENWVDIMTLGNQNEVNPGEAENTDEIGFVLPDHEISYNTKKVTNLNVKARYLKFEITRTKVGADKWVRFQELEINDGEYIPSVNNPTFTSNTQETRNGLFSYMTDGDISTMFIPKDANSYVNYSLSTKNNVNTIKIIQNAAIISNAVVQARVLDNTGATQWINLGTLSQAINEFVLSEDTILFDVKIEWGDVIPNIIELSTYQSSFSDVNKDNLQSLIDNKENTSTWIMASVEAYNAVYNAGKAVLESNYVSQTTVDNAIQAINNVITNKLLKGDIRELQDLLDNALTDENNYTASTWLVYNKAINAVRNAIENADNTSENDILVLTNNLNLARDGLVFNPSNQEEAIITIESENEFIASITNPEDIYTVASWQNYIDAKTELEQLLLDNEITPIHPDVFIKALDKLTSAKDSLEQKVTEVDKVALSIAIDMAEAVTQEQLDKVVPVVANEFKAALENAKEVYENTDATQVDVDNAFDRLASVMQMLEFFKGDKTALQKMVDQITNLTASEYIESTWNALQAVLPSVNEVLSNENAMQEEIDEVYTELVKAFVNLRLKPNKDLLQDLINKANGINRANYTSASLKLVDAEVEKASEVLNNPEATKEEVEAAVSALTKILSGLEAKTGSTVDTSTSVKPGDTTVSVKTGDTTNMMYPLLGLAIASLGVYGSKKRRYR